MSIVGTGPAWSAVDEATESLLTLVADDGRLCVDAEWDEFVRCLHWAAIHDADYLIRPNALRPLVRGKIAPRRIGAFTNRALSQGLVEYTGDWEVSDDTEGRNGGKPARIMRWLGGAS